MDEPVSDQASAASDHPAIALPAVAGPPPTGTDGHRARWWLFVVCLLGLLVGAAWVWTSEAGWRATCRLLSAVGGGQLSIRGASGSLGTAPAVA